MGKALRITRHIVAALLAFVAATMFYSMLTEPAIVADSYAIAGVIFAVAAYLVSPWKIRRHHSAPKGVDA